MLEPLVPQIQCLSVYIHQKNQKSEEVAAYLSTSRPQRHLRFALGDSPDSYWGLAAQLTSYVVLEWTRLQIKAEEGYVLLSNV